jgi:hypothetical protein
MHPNGERLGERGNVEGQLVGDGVQAAAIRLGHEQSRGEAALWSTVADPADLVVTRLDDNAVSDPHARDGVADPFDGAGHLVPEAHRFDARPSETTHSDIRQVAAADPARGHSHDRVTRTRLWFGNVVDSNVAGPVNAYLQHGG